MFGLGCVAGAAGLARLHDLLRGNPEQVAVLLSVELCSLTVQRDDDSTANLVASGLFGDGAERGRRRGRRARRAAARASGPRVIDSRSHLYPGSQRTMGWDVSASGLKIVLDANVPTLVRRYLGEDVRHFLDAHGLKRSEISAWVSHPGGPKVIEAIQDVLDLPPDALALHLGIAGRGRQPVLVVGVARAAARRSPPGRRPARPALLMAMGPGLLLRARAARVDVGHCRR